jgi:hypothetical protein
MNQTPVLSPCQLILVSTYFYLQKTLVSSHQPTMSQVEVLSVLRLAGCLHPHNDHRTITREDIVRQMRSETVHLPDLWKMMKHWPSGVATDEDRVREDVNAKADE